MADFIIEGDIVIGKQLSYKNLLPNIGQAIFDTLSKDPSHVAQIEADTEKQTCFKEMKDKSVSCALWMQQQNLNPDDIVVICTENRLDAYVPVFATFFVDAIYCAWNHDITSNVAEHLMQLFRPKLIFTCEKTADILKNASKSSNIPVEFIAFEDNSDMRSLNYILRQQANTDVNGYTPRNKKGNRDVSAIVLTSGSTGFPKGVMISSKVLVQTFYPDILSFGGKIALWYTTLHWVSGLICTLTSIFNRSTRILHLCKELDVVETCRVIEKYKVNQVYFPPILLGQLSKSEDIKKYDLGTLATILTGGSKLSKNSYEKLREKYPNTKIIQGYGMTELVGTPHMMTGKTTNYHSFGSVTPNVEAKIINRETGAKLTAHEVGELFIRSPYMMLGYYENSKETERVIDKEGWMHTGDLCYYNEKGEFFFVSRLSELIKYRSFQISPVEIEEILMTHPAVMEVAVVPIPHSVDGDLPMAFVKTVPGRNVSKEELITLSSEIGEHKKLRGGVEFLNDIPKIVFGKFNRMELRERAKILAKANGL